MTPGEHRNVGASVRARLLNRSRETGENFQSLLQRYTAERFLYRLGESRHREHYVLKGAMLLALWGETTYRPTRDLDFTGYGGSSEDEVRRVICDVCDAPVADDGVVFHSETLTLAPIREDGEYDSLRARVEARLANARIRMQIDTGFGDAVHPAPVEVHYPVLLEAPRPRIRVYPREAVVAEKFHAMVANAERNSRYKDFYDLHTLAQHFSFGGQDLAQAIQTTFDQRRTPFPSRPPVALTLQFYTDAARADRWQGYLNRNRLHGAPSHFTAVGEFLLSFLREPWDALVQGSVFTGGWPKGGPWRHYRTSCQR